MLQCQQAPSFTLETGAGPVMLAHSSPAEQGTCLLQDAASDKGHGRAFSFDSQVAVLVYHQACQLHAAVHMKLWSEGDAVAMQFRAVGWSDSPGAAQTQRCAAKIMWLLHSTQLSGRTKLDLSVCKQ